MCQKLIQSQFSSPLAKNLVVLSKISKLFANLKIKSLRRSMQAPENDTINKDVTMRRSD
jgi:hypothetical protein